jgi:uroporphyrinogen-III synthase
MPFDGLRVLSLESRRSVEIEKLIRAQRGQPFVAPSMREVPLDANTAAFAFAERLFRGEFDMMILLTGVGARLLNQTLETRYPAGAFPDALRKLTVVARGSKPVAVLREWGVPAAIAVGEPNTWREILAALDGRNERDIAVQEYGRPSDELIDGLKTRGAAVTSVPVYQWDLPLDTAPLQTAARKLVNGEFDVILFTTSIQIAHLFKIAADDGALRAALNKIVIASVGPTTTETLADFGLKPDVEPSHPKMGFLVNETAAQAARILESKS